LKLPFILKKFARMPILIEAGIIGMILTILIFNIQTNNTTLLIGEEVICNNLGITVEETEHCTYGNANSLELYKVNVLISFIFSKLDQQTDFVTFVTGIEVTTVFIACFVGTIMSLYEKGKAMRHYIPIIKDNMICLEKELKSSCCTQERRQYIAAVHYLCSYIYSNDKYRFDHYKK